MNKKPILCLYIIFFTVALSTSIPVIVNNNYSMYISLFLFLSELVFVFTISNIAMLCTTECIMKEHYQCKLINKSKLTINISRAFNVLFLLILIFKNIIVLYGKLKALIFIAYLLYLLYSLILIFTLSNRVYLSNEVLFLTKYQKAIYIKDVVTLTSDKMNEIEVTTTKDKYVFSGSQNTVETIKSKIQ